MDNNSDKILVINEKIDKVKELMKETKNVRMYKRYLVILRHLEGSSNLDIAKMVSLEQHTVGDYIKNYKINGLPGLVMKHSTGAPRKLNIEQENLIVETITNKTPDEVGFESRKNWTIEIVRQWIINNFNITMSHRGTHEILRRLNLSYTRPTYVLKKADKEKQAKFKSVFEGLKKLTNGEVDHLLFQDESMIRDYQAIQKTWFKKGQQRKIPTYGKNAGVKL